MRRVWKDAGYYSTRAYAATTGNGEWLTRSVGSGRRGVLIAKGVYNAVSRGSTVALSDLRAALSALERGGRLW